MYIHSYINSYTLIYTHIHSYTLMYTRILLYTHIHLRICMSVSTNANGDVLIIKLSSNDVFEYMGPDLPSWIDHIKLQVIHSYTLVYTHIHS